MLSQVHICKDDLYTSKLCHVLTNAYGKFKGQNDLIISFFLSSFSFLIELHSSILFTVNKVGSQF